MIKVTVYRDELGNWTGFKSEGHAMQSGNSKYDLVCSAISMHLQTIEYSLTKIITNINVEKKDGYLELIFQINEDERLRGIEYIFLNGIEILHENYRNSIKVHNKEVEFHV
ncbi:MAG: ribosomal-processing cysteine protease Prp [Firmicutes bacterium]|nr:ribosomal-processing cysteine protease Prp [Bacillota bacterium]